MKPGQRTAFATVTFTGATDNELLADVFGSQGNPVLLLHGASQTRHDTHAVIASDDNCLIDTWFGRAVTFLFNRLATATL